jgi:hypothetical protein
MCGEGTIGGLAGFSLAPGSGLCTARIIARPDILQPLHCSKFVFVRACGERNYSKAPACTYHTPIAPTLVRQRGGIPHAERNNA